MDRRRRGGSNARWALVASVCALALAPATAGAQLGLMPIYALSPPSGSTLSLQPSFSSTRVVFQSAPAGAFDMISGITFEVASQNVAGLGGTLSDDFNVDYDFIHASDTDPSIYVTAFRHFNFIGHRPGVYFFQFSAYTYFTHQHVASPVFSFVWDPAAGGTSAPAPAPAPAPAAAQPDLTMTSANAVHYLRVMILRKTGHPPRGLRARCTRVTASTFSCRPSFRVGRRTYSGHFTARHIVGSDGVTVYWRGSFVGRRGGQRVFWLV